MLGATKLRRVFVTMALVLGILPVRPLIVTLGARGSAAQQCLLHGSGCQCAAHCGRTGQHRHQAQETAAKPACHRDPAGHAPLGSKVFTEPGEDASTPAFGCGMASCGKEAPLLLTSLELPCLAASSAVDLCRDPGFEALRVPLPFAPFSLETSPPTPPPQS